MNTLFMDFCFLTFATMEFMAWFTQIHYMAFCGVAQRSSSQRPRQLFERNDAFFIFYAVVSMICFYFWSYEGFGLDFLSDWELWLMVLPILWCMTYLFINASKCSES